MGTFSNSCAQDRVTLGVEHPQERIQSQQVRYEGQNVTQLRDEFHQTGPIIYDPEASGHNGPDENNQAHPPQFASYHAEHQARLVRPQRQL